jgi:hypothetical protein
VAAIIFYITKDYIVKPWFSQPILL